MRIHPLPQRTTVLQGCNIWKGIIAVQGVYGRLSPERSCAVHLVAFLTYCSCRSSARWSCRASTLVGNGPKIRTHHVSDDQVLRREVFGAVLKPAGVSKAVQPWAVWGNSQSIRRSSVPSSDRGWARQVFQQMLMVLHHPMRVSPIVLADPRCGVLGMRVKKIPEA